MPWPSLRPPATPEVDLVERTVEVDGLRIAYREERSWAEHGVAQRPLVLIHGLGMSSASFRWLIPHLVDEFHVIALDLPGCGDSDRPVVPMSVAELVDAVAAWATALDLPQADFLGHSLGGQVVSQLAALHPERVRRAVLVAATPDPVTGGAVAKAARLLLDGMREPLWFVATAVRDYVRARPSAMWWTLRRALQIDAETLADRLDVPTLVVRGSRDPIITQIWAEELHRRLDLGRLVVVPGGTHGLPAQSPQALAHAVRDFLLTPDP